MDPAYVAAHIEADARHWWFVGRRAVLRSVLRATLPPRRLRLAEIGCGTGAFLSAAAEFGEVVGVEASPEFLALARGSGFTVLPGSLPDRLPLDADSCDVVLLFDVLEHLDDDAAALRAVARILKPEGLLVSTVPAFPWLWSAHDEALGHRRRYTARSLSQVTRAAGLHPHRVTYFNSLVALPIVAVRFLGRLRRRAPGAASRTRHDLGRHPLWLNALLARVFASEAELLRWMSFPFGISLLMVARRNG